MHHSAATFPRRKKYIICSMDLASAGPYSGGHVARGLKMRNVRVAIVDDDRPFLEEVSLFLTNVPGIGLVDQYTAGKGAIRGILAYHPDIALIDLGLPDCTGLEVIRSVREQNRTTQWLVLTVFDDDDSLFAALQVGAKGYLVKADTSATQLAEGIEAVIKGEAPMSRGISRRILRAFEENPTNGERLTRREREVLEHLRQGFPPKRVADKLGISYHTVRKHLSDTYEKLQVHSVVAALAAYGGKKPAF